MHIPDFNTYNIINILPAGHNHLWIGTGNGIIYILDSKTGLSQVLGAKDLFGIEGSEIFPMAIDLLDQKAWIYSQQRGMIYEMEIASKKCHPIVFKDTAGRIMQERDIQIWHGSPYPYANGSFFFYTGNGVYRISKDSAVAKQVLVCPKNKGIRYMAMAEERLIFLRFHDAPSNFTFTNRNGTWVQTPNPIDSMDWSDIYFNKEDQSYWVGNTKELAHFDKDFHTIRIYTDKDELPSLGVAQSFRIIMVISGLITSVVLFRNST